MLENKVMPPYLDSHALNVIEAVHQAPHVAAVTELVGHEIVFELGSIDVVVCRVSVHEAIQKEGIERDPPVLG